MKIYILFPKIQRFDKNKRKTKLLDKNKIFQFCFHILNVERKGYHVVDLHFHENQMLRDYAALNVTMVFFDYEAPLGIMMSSINILTFAVSSCNDKSLVKSSYWCHSSTTSYDFFNFTKFCMKINGTLNCRFQRL